jgi:hypothetical protein
MKNILTVVVLLVCLSSFADPVPNILNLPLPSTSETVYVQIDEKFQLRAEPDQDGWEIGVVTKLPQNFPSNLLYHSKKWHGPYPTQIYAWHLLKDYFPNTRWLCVSGQPIEVMLEIRDAKIKPDGESAVFESGQLHVEWFHRRCTKGFGN